MENIYGAGQKPVGRGYGKIEYSGSIGLLRGERSGSYQSKLQYGKIAGHCSV
jgi:hypothetical protein